MHSRFVWFIVITFMPKKQDNKCSAYDHVVVYNPITHTTTIIK